MSRIGRKPVKLPAGVTVTAADGRLSVKGPKGELSRLVAEGIHFEFQPGVALVARENDTPKNRSAHGLMRALLANMVTGVTVGYTRHLDILGVGYKAEVKGKTLVMNLGFSHQIIYPFPNGITIDVETNTKLAVKGIDKEMVGQVASELRSFRPPDSYKGKGVRYRGEHVRLKAGKSAQK